MRKNVLDFQIKPKARQRTGWNGRELAKRQETQIVDRNEAL